MKNIMKMSAIAMALMVGGNAYAEEASATFQWTGTVTAAPVSGSVKIVNTGTHNFDEGMLTFAESSTVGNYDIASSTQLIFQVQEDTGTVAPTDTLKYEVKNLKFAAGGGFMTEVDAAAPEFTVVADATTELDKGSQFDVSLNKDVSLTLTNKKEIDFVKAGDEVAVQATVLVTHEK
ncbi:hypothetical protein CGI23_24225 [Vibrio parahaemolyticus]|uniref:hypothetical protein n=1 Tax=Vibrio parahaemolyticus TaxID=670 RepID=UPI00111FF41A|nr:hypothetical protein [Vibrio parahaemolyticus]TOK18363.1 hypothetical protein CGI23_24225 [Vibrio parahaemolyticus]